MYSETPSSEGGGGLGRDRGVGGGETNSLDLLLQLIVLLGGLLGLSTGLLRVELGEALLVFWVRIRHVDAFVGRVSP